MIQRIQTIYLLLVTALLITSMCLPVGSFIGADAAMYVFKPLGVEMNGTLYSTWGGIWYLVAQCNHCIRYDLSVQEPYVANSYDDIQ